MYRFQFLREGESMHKPWLPYVWITVIGLFLLIITWFIYVGLYLSIEHMYYPNDPQDFPADTLRLASALVLLVIYVGTSMLYDKPLIKAIGLVPVVSMMVIALYLSFYGRPWVGFFWILVFGFHIIFFLRKIKVPTYTYYAVIYAALLALAYTL